MTHTFRDAHLHLYAHGEQVTCVPLADCASLDDCLERLARRAEQVGPGEWVRAAGARVEAWPERRFPTAREIDKAVGARPAFVRSFDLHACALSGELLSRTGITRDTPDPEGGRILRDDRAEPTGVLLENAAFLVRPAIPTPSPTELKETVRAALRDLLAHNIVETHDMHAQEWLGPTLAALIDEGDHAASTMTFRLYAPLTDLRRAHDDAPNWTRDNLTLAGGKVFLDGTLNSRTAYLLEPFADPLPGLPRGERLYTDAALDDAIRLADSLRLPLAMHAIGDAAVRYGLDALERTSPRTHGFRIEHAQFVHERDVPRFTRLNVIASPQPCHLLCDVEALRRLTPHLIPRAFPIRDLLQAEAEAGRAPGEAVWFGSDTPVVSPAPADNLQAAVHRARRNDPTSSAISPEQSITTEQFLACSRPAR